MAKQSKSFGSERAFRAHFSYAHGTNKEVADLRRDVEEGFQNNEARASFPHLDWLDVSSGVVKAAGGDITLMGRNLLQSQTFDTKTFGTGAAAVAVTCQKPGDSGLSCKIVQGATLAAVLSRSGVGSSLSISGSTVTLTTTSTLYSTNDIGTSIVIAGATTPANNGTFPIVAGGNATTVKFTNAAGVTEAFTGTWEIGGSNLLTVTLATAGNTATEVTAQINGALSCIGVIFAVAGGAGSGTVLVASQANLVGGAGLYAGNKVWVSGIEALPKQAASQWTNTSIIVTVPALTSRATLDTVNITVSSNGIYSESLSAVLLT